MDPHSAAATYRTATFENAPPIKIVRMMYQGAIRYLEDAAALDPASEGIAFRDLLGKAEAVVIELRISLDGDAAPEVSTSLEQLYLFVEDKILEARDSSTTEPIEAACSILRTLGSAWSEIEVSADKPEKG